MTRPLPESILKSAEAVLQSAMAAGLRIATAESCTGGLIAACLTERPGASKVFDRGFVTYSNESKHELLGVSERDLRDYGAVSEPVASAMAQGALVNSPADIAVAVTGIAGPGGGSAEKPVGLVYIAGVRRGGAARVEHHVFPGHRAAIRLATVAAALSLLLSLADAPG